MQINSFISFYESNKNRNVYIVDALVMFISEVWTGHVSGS